MLTLTHADVRLSNPLLSTAKTSPSSFTQFIIASSSFSSLLLFACNFNELMKKLMKEIHKFNVKHKNDCDFVPTPIRLGWNKFTPRCEGEAINSAR